MTRTACIRYAPDWLGKLLATLPSAPQRIETMVCSDSGQLLHRYSFNSCSGFNSFARPENGFAAIPSCEDCRSGPGSLVILDYPVHRSSQLDLVGSSPDGFHAASAGLPIAIRSVGVYDLAQRHALPGSSNAAASSIRVPSRAASIRRQSGISGEPKSRSLYSVKA
jgi:hypothetical protein